MRERGKEKRTKRKRKRGRRQEISYSVHWSSDRRNSLNKGVKSRDLMRGYASKGWNYSYFGLFLAFGYCFGMILERCCAMLMAWDGFVACFKGCFRSEFGLKICIYESYQNAPTTLGHAIAWIGAIVWLLVYSNFGRSYFSCPNSNSRFFRLCKKIFESRIYPYASDWHLVLTLLLKF